MIESKFNKAIESLQRAKREYESGNKRLALGSLDFAQDRLNAVKYLIIAEIKEDEE